MLSSGLTFWLCVSGGGLDNTDHKENGLTKMTQISPIFAVLCA
jgi:hypothetical protein